MRRKILISKAARRLDLKKYVEQLNICCENLSNVENFDRWNDKNYFYWGYVKFLPTNIFRGAISWEFQKFID